MGTPKDRGDSERANPVTTSGSGLPYQGTVCAGTKAGPMEVRPCSCHGNLQSFYDLLNQRSLSPFANGPGLIRVVESLRALPDPRIAFVMASQNILCVLPTDTYNPPWPIRVHWHYGHFTVKYRLPEHLAPWKDADVDGNARTPEEAARKILIAVERCEAWR